jgi:hypothetical protein
MLTQFAQPQCCQATAETALADGASAQSVKVLEEIQDLNIKQKEGTFTTFKT